MSNGISKRQTKDGNGLPVSRIETISQGIVDLSRVGYLADLDSDEIQKYQLECGDLLFSHINSDLHLGKTAVFAMEGQPLIHGMNLLLIRVDRTKLLPVFLHWLFNYYRTAGLFMSIAQHAVNQSSINQRKLNALPIIVPPLPEQRRIVAEIEKQFTRLEAGVAALRRVQANLKRYRAAVLKAACEGQLVPTEVELHRQRKTKSAKLETGAELLTRILAERRKNWIGRGKYKEPVAPNVANLPKLSDGWCWAGTEQVTAGIDNAITIGPFGSNLMVKDYRDNGVSLIFVREIRSENFRRRDTRYVSAEKAAELSTHKVRGGDVVITKMGEPPGDTAIYPADLPDAIATSDCIKLTPNLSGTTSAFLKYIIRGQPVKNQIERVTRGVAQKKMSLARFKTVAVPLPPLAEQTRIVAEVERRLSVVEELESVVSANLQRATRLRQSILQKAFTGELCA